MYFQTIVVEIWSALLILFDLLENAVYIPGRLIKNLNWRFHCSSKPQEVFIDPLAIPYPHSASGYLSTPWMVQFTPGGRYRPPD